MPLTGQEIQLIAGRAGRFGQQDEGPVSAFTEQDLDFIDRAISLPCSPIAAPFYVRPKMQHVQTIFCAS